MSYEAFSEFAGSWGLVILVVLFLVALVYALWPGNREKFRRAARRPLDEDNTEEGRNDRDAGKG